MASLKDAKERTLATDPTESFIVEAPAGSGKTELLTQRFLRLLGKVKEPEQIVALTFTRKAAGEMRERILHALAHAQTGIEPDCAHQKLTFNYAQTALAQDSRQHWQLLKQPHRLRILTIDALCQMLSHAIPLPEKELPFAQINSEPQALYQLAARNCIQHAVDTNELHLALTTILSHLDNRQDRLIALLVKLLQTREQWLEILFDARSMKKSAYEEALRFIEEHALERLTQALPETLHEQLCTLSRTVAGIENDPQKPRYPLRDWHTFAPLNREMAAALASLLLTGSGQLRKRFDHYVGLSKANCQDPLFSELRAQSQTLMENLDSLADFNQALLRVSRLPEPQYDAEQWEVLQALFTLLPLLTAHLHLLFKEENQCDFTAVANQAIQALGNEDAPTDLTLYLDNVIHHLLIDEFQDTSLQQYRLLQRLVMGWQPGDGRTLFVVGDPMQSIYRFRQAEVGLFLKAKSQGIGEVKLIPLQLCCNFRSAQHVVSWINQRFSTIFPQDNDIEAGAIAFHASTAIHDNPGKVLVQASQFADKADEARALIQVIKDELADCNNEFIAVLVRSRSHLQEIIPLLRQENIAFQGVEIEKLSALDHIKDIWVLSKCLLYPADRLAWLALLRSPWCGLSLADLHAIANFDSKKSILHALQRLEEINNLSDDGRTRALYLHAVMQDALAFRQQDSLVNWVMQTAERLHAQHLLQSEQQADLEQFWLLLEKHCQDGQLADLTRFQEALAQLYSQQSMPSRLQIMTIHKSKGLEFDCVILPGLGNTPPQKEQPLLRFLKIPSRQQQDLLLLSPIRAAHHKQCPLYDYLGDLEAEKAHYELQRLLYVAATRAKKRLYLLDNQDNANKKATFRALLQSQEFAVANESNHDIAEKEAVFPQIRKLCEDFYIHPPQATQADNHPITLTEATTEARLLGVVTHEILQWICTYHPSHLQEIPWGMLNNRLRQHGFSAQNINIYMQQIQNQLERFLQNPVGSWICQPHEQERNEYELLTTFQGQAATRIIDRTFVDKGKRWVIDFKTGADDPVSLKKHQQQVNGYAALIREQFTETIHCGLFYLESGKWLDWQF